MRSLTALLLTFTLSSIALGSDKAQAPMEDSDFTDLISDRLLMRHSNPDRQTTFAPHLIDDDLQTGQWHLGVSAQVYSPRGTASLVNGDAFEIASQGFKTALLGLFFNRSAISQFGKGFGVGIESTFAMSGYRLNLIPTAGSATLPIRVLQTFVSIGPNLEWVIPRTREYLTIGTFARIGALLSAYDADLKLRRRFAESAMGEAGARLRISYTKWGFIQGEYVFRSLIGNTKGNAVAPHNGVLTLGFIL